MCNTAAHLVDRVIPNVPIRQWVLSLPWALRPLVARDAEALSAVARIAVECISRELARASGQDEPLAGAVAFVHRAGGSLNLSPHFHIGALDGVLVRDGGGERLRFLEAEAPSPARLATVIERIRHRVAGWLRRHGRLDERPFEDRSNETPEQTALDGCLSVGLSKGALVAVAPAARHGSASAESEADEQAFEPRRRSRYAVELEGFNLHAGVRVTADNDVGRERLLRYCARPSVSLERLSLRPDGLVAYRVRHSRRDETHRVMTPLELMARLAALVPPPRHPLVRYFGVLSSRSKWRALVVPRVPCLVPASAPRCHHQRSATRDHGPAPRPASRRGDHRLAGGPVSLARALPQLSPVGSPAWKPQEPALLTPSFGSQPAAGSSRFPSAPGRTEPSPAFEAHPFNVITVPHLERLLGGELLATSPRLDWARLLRRTYGFEPLSCPHCAGRLRPIAEITDSAVATQILDAIGWRRCAPPPRARTPAPGVRPRRAPS